jgi:hypothetical protein
MLGYVVDSTGSGQGYVGDSWERGNEPRDCVDRLNDYQLLQKNSGPWSDIV